MKKNTLILIAAALLAAGCAEKKSGEPQLKTIEDTLSWIMGESFAQTLPQESFFNLNKELMFEAIRYTLEGREQPIDDTTFNGGMQYIMMQSYAYQKKQTERKRHLADSTQTVFFRNLVATNKNVKQHPAGFYYEVLREARDHAPNMPSAYASTTAVSCSTAPLSTRHTAVATRSSM